MSGGVPRSLITGCVGMLLMVSCTPAKQNLSEEKAAERLSEGAVIVKIEKMPGRDARLGCVTGVVDAPRERVWKVISDYNEQKNFMPNLLEGFAIRPEALELIRGATPDELVGLESKLKEYKTDALEGRVVYTYGMGDFPWPMPDKRYILRIERDAERYTTRSTMVIGQMKTNETSWELAPYGPDGSRTLATYKVLLDPGMPLPGFAIDMAASSTLPEVIKAVRRKVKDPKYGRSRNEMAETAWRFAETAAGAT